jgi:hypothetical protein
MGRVSVRRASGGRAGHAAVVSWKEGKRASATHVMEPSSMEPLATHSSSTARTSSCWAEELLLLLLNRSSRDKYSSNLCLRRAKILSVTEPMVFAGKVKPVMTPEGSLFFKLSCSARNSLYRLRTRRWVPELKFDSMLYTTCPLEVFE